MSLGSEINRLKTAKSDIATAIRRKGVAVSSQTKFDAIAALIDKIRNNNTSDTTYTAIFKETSAEGIMEAHNNGKIIIVVNPEIIQYIDELGPHENIRLVYYFSEFSDVDNGIMHFRSLSQYYEAGSIIDEETEIVSSGNYYSRIFCNWGALDTEPEEIWQGPIYTKDKDVSVTNIYYYGKNSSDNTSWELIEAIFAASEEKPLIQLQYMVSSENCISIPMTNTIYSSNGELLELVFSGIIGDKVYNISFSSDSTWTLNHETVHGSGEDATLLRIDSSQGILFKNNLVSTVLSATIYHGSERITNITDLRRVFGSTASLRWSWKRLDDDRFGIISATDSRISADGFMFTISPNDVDVKVTFICELIIS